MKKIKNMEKNVKKAILFCRSSSIQQDYNYQITELTELAHSDGYTDSQIAVVAYKESATKNDISKRVSIGEMNRIIATNPIESVYVTEISRLARRDDVLMTVLNTLNQHEIALVSMKPMLLRTFEKINGRWVKNNTTDLIIKILSYVAEEEIKNKNFRQKAGYAQKKAEGKLVASKVIIGYKRSSENTPEVDEHAASVVNDIFNRYLEGDSVTTIFEAVRRTKYFSNIVNEKSGWNRITRILRDKAYVGQHKMFNYPPIVSQEVFDKVQQKLDSNQLVKTNISNVYYCQGLLKYHGHCLTPNATHATYNYRNPNTCISIASVNANVIDSVAFERACVVAAIAEGKVRQDNRERFTKELERAVDSQKGLAKAIQSTKNKLSRIQEDYYNGRLSRESYDDRYADAQKTLDRLYQDEKDNNLKITQLRQGLESSNSTLRSTDYHAYSSIEDDQLRKQLVRENITSIDVEKEDDGCLLITCNYKDNVLPPDTLKYVRKGCKLYLYLLSSIDQQIAEDWTGCWDNRIKSLVQRRKG